MFNLLIDECPDVITIDDINYKINTNFRTSILFELLMQDDNLSGEQKISIALGLYYPIIPNDLKEAVESMLWFYRCGQGNLKQDNKSLPEDELEAQDNTNEDSNKGQVVYSFEHDSDYIYSAYLTQYNIDLNEIEYLHWWKFKALFKSLNNDNKLIEIMNIRGTKITKDMSKERRRELRELQKIYELPDNRTEQEKQAEFSDEFDSLF